MAREISVVIPVHNRAHSVAGAIASVLRQTLPTAEVIVVDDASTDGTAEVVESLADPRLRLIRHPRNAGPGAARNTGLRAARYDWVAFQDSDDEWLPEKLARQVAALDRMGDRAVGVYCGMIVIGEPGADRVDPAVLRYVPKHRPGAHFEGDLANMLLRHGSFISTQTFLGRRDQLLEIGGFDETMRMLEDWDCFIRLARTGPIAFAPEPLVLQRFSPDSLTRSIRNRTLATETIVARNAAAYAAMPDALAERCRILAGGWRMAGEPGRAVRWIARGLRLAPYRPRLWAGLALALAAWVRPRGTPRQEPGE